MNKLIPLFSPANQDKNAQIPLFVVCYHPHEELLPSHFVIMDLLERLNLGRFDYWEYLGTGRPAKCREFMIRSFVLQKILRLQEMKSVIAILKRERILRQICGWRGVKDVPSEATFSRFLDEIAKDGTIERIIESIKLEKLSGRVYESTSIDSTSIGVIGRSGYRVPKKEAKSEVVKKKRGRPKQGEVRPEKPKSVIEAQINLSSKKGYELVKQGIDFVVKRNSQGFYETTFGVKCHAEVAQNGTPINIFISAASVHDSQVALPLMKQNSDNITRKMHLMDAAYDDQHIRSFTANSLIDFNHRSKTDAREFNESEKIIYKNRTVVERFNSELKQILCFKRLNARNFLKAKAHILCASLLIFMKHCDKP